MRSRAKRKVSRMKRRMMGEWREWGWGDGEGEAAVVIVDEGHD